MPASAGSLLPLGLLGWAGVATNSHAGNSDADKAVERLSMVVTWFMLVLFFEAKT